MNTDFILKQIRDLQDLQPLLKVLDLEQGIAIGGTYNLDASYQSIRLTDDFEIRIEIPIDYPNSVPILYELSNKVPPQFEHKYKDNSCCIGVDIEIYQKFIQNPTLLFFVNEFVVSFLYSVAWHQRFSNLPYGERPHGVAGIIEYYKEFWKTDDEKKAARLLHIALAGNYRGHAVCPCGSGMKARKCHGEQFKKIITFPKKELYVRNFYEMYYHIKQKEDAKKLWLKE